MAHIRIESDERVVTNAKVFYVGKDGDEVDISNCISAVDLNLAVGEAATATLLAFVGSAHVTAEVKDIVINRLGPKRRPPWRRFLDATRMGDQTREFGWSSHLKELS